MPQPRLLLSKKALKRNLETLIKVSGNLPAFPVLKANAYGLGLKEVASVFEEFSIDKVPYFCLARLNEVEEARALGIKRRLLLLSGWIGDFRKLPKNTDISVTCNDDLKKVAESRRTLRFHLKFNTGMNRLGFREFDNEFIRLLEKAKKRKHLLMGVGTQLATADVVSNDFSAAQLAKFEVGVLKIQDIWGSKVPFIHFENSQGVMKSLGRSSKLVNAFRPGIHLWGVADPDAKIDLSPVISLRVPVRQLYWIEKGETVGYGRKFTAKTRMKIATLNYGYADGMRRGSWKKNLKMFLGKAEVPLIGNESMDLCSVDCTGLKNKKIMVGTELEWIGPHQSIEQIAKAWETLPYEVLTSISPRIVRELT